jgi:vacuolar protein sorting-associated protein 13A/C
LPEKTNEKLEYVSPYTIRNDTGYTIEIEREYTKAQIEKLGKKSKLVTKKFKLLSGESMNFQIEQDLEKMFKEHEETSDISQNIKIKANIKSDFNEINAIPGIDLDRVRTKRYPLEGEKLMMKDMSLVCNVMMEEISYRKILKLSSSLLFENQTNKILEVNVYIDKSKTIPLQLNPNDILPIPLDLVKSQVRVRYTDSSSWSELFQLDKILNNNHDTSHEIKFGKFFSILRIKKDDGGLGKTTVVIEPPYILKNCLPIDINLQVISKSQTEGISLLLGPQQIYQEHELSVNNKVFLKAKVQGFFWSERVMLYSPNSEPNKQINFRDALGHQGHCYIHHVECFTLSKQFFFYVKSYIINESTYDLLFYGVEDKGKRYVLGGQQPMCPEEALDFNEKLILLGDGKKIMVAEKDTRDQISKEVTIGGVGTSTCDFKTHLGHLEMGVSLSLVLVGNLNNSRAFIESINAIVSKYRAVSLKLDKF